MFWVITRDHIGAGDTVGYGHIPAHLGIGDKEYRFVNLCDPRIKEWVDSLRVEFRLFDDDGELYFEGVASEAEFDAQDWAQPRYGVTYTEIKGADGKWEML